MVLPIVEHFLPAEGLEQVKGVSGFLWRTPERVEMAEGPGFEPGLTGPEPVVLPLDDPSVVCKADDVYNIYLNASSKF